MSQNVPRRRLNEGRHRVFQVLELAQRQQRLGFQSQQARPIRFGRQCPVNTAQRSDTLFAFQGICYFPQFPQNIAALAVPDFLASSAGAELIGVQGHSSRPN